MRTTYNVAPRWSGGSPAMVSEDIAQRVARQEIAHHAMAFEGAYGDDRQEEARCQPYALRGIVERRTEYPTGWLVVDMLTHETAFRFAERPDRRPPTPAQRRKARELLRRDAGDGPERVAVAAGGSLRLARRQ